MEFEAGVCVRAWEGEHVVCAFESTNRSLDTTVWMFWPFESLHNTDTMVLYNHGPHNVVHTASLCFIQRSVICSVYKLRFMKPFKHSILCSKNNNVGHYKRVQIENVDQEQNHEGEAKQKENEKRETNKTHKTIRSTVSTWVIKIFYVIQHRNCTAQLWFLHVHINLWNSAHHQRCSHHPTLSSLSPSQWTQCLPCMD